MTDERFNELLNGPLNHPLFPFKLTRLAMALRTVVEVTGEAGEKALEDFCQQREARDHDDPNDGLPAGDQDDV